MKAIFAGLRVAAAKVTEMVGKKNGAHAEPEIVNGKGEHALVVVASGLFTQAQGQSRDDYRQDAHMFMVNVGAVLRQHSDGLPINMRPQTMVMTNDAVAGAEERRVMVVTAAMGYETVRKALNDNGAMAKLNALGLS